MTVPYYFNTWTKADWLVEESALYESYRDVCNPNPRERKTWEATFTVKHHDLGKRAVVMAAYWPGKPVQVEYLWGHVLSDVPTFGVNEHLYTRVARAGRYNPSSALDLAYRGTVESPKREDYREDTHGLFAYGAYHDAIDVWRKSCAQARDHNYQHQPIRDAISGVLCALERKVKKGMGDRNAGLRERFSGRFWGRGYTGSRGLLRGERARGAHGRRCRSGSVSAMRCVHR